MSEEIKVNETMQRSLKAVGQLEGLLGEMEELLVPRTQFALEHFVVGQHDTPGQQRRQVLAELRAFLFALMDDHDEVRLLELDIADLEAAPVQTERVQIEINRKARQKRQYEMNIRLKMAEVEVLLELLNRLPKYTRAELEAEEQKYWPKRLNRQMFLQLMGDPGNMDAVLQMLFPTAAEKPELPSIITDRLIKPIVEMTGNAKLLQAVPGKALPEGEKHV